MNEKTLDSSGQYVYKLFDSAVLTDEQVSSGEEIVQKYILQPGEYFIHTDKDSVEILYAGTKITRISKSKRVEAMVCIEADIDSVPEVGVSDIDSVLRQINSGEKIVLTEMQIKTVPANATLYLGAYDWQRDSLLEVTPNAQLRGTKILGKGNTPQSYSLKADAGKTAYNPEFEDGCRWHTDTDGSGNGVYIDDPSGYADNVDITKLLNIDPTGKDPNMVGLKPRYGYTNVESLEAPYFEPGVFYEKIDETNNDIYDNNNYRALEVEPANWSTNFSNYYWKRPIHAYNPNYSSSVLWEDDNGLSVEEGTQWITCWQEDEEYLALGYQVNEQDVFPDLEKLDGTPDDADGEFVGGSNVYVWNAWYDLRGRSASEIEQIKSQLYNHKYLRVGADPGPYVWYRNNHYKDFHESRLPKTTHHAYNPKYMENGYMWEKFSIDDTNEDTKGFIRITGEGCSPSKCLLTVDQFSTTSAYTLNSSGNIDNYWAIEYNDYDFIELDDAPSDAVIWDGENNSYYSENVNTVRMVGTELTNSMKLAFFEERRYNPNFKYIVLVDNSDPAIYNGWYECVYSDVGAWVKVDDWEDHNTQDNIKNGLNYIQLSTGDDPTVNDYVSIIPKLGQCVINSQSDSSSMESYEITYFRAAKSYIPKSWTQNIEFIKGQNVREIKNIDYYTDPNLEGMSPSLGSHVIHQYSGYAWLEDYHYAFDDAQTSSSIGSASSVNVVGVTPNDEDYKIPATKDGKAYNPNFSYNYVWQEDNEYIAWETPIVVLNGGHTNPYDAHISVYSLDQHVINPTYVSGYKWERISSKPSGSNSKNTYYFTGNTDSPPNIQPSLEEPYGKDGYVKKYAQNTESDVWWQVSIISGKSWTSVRVPVGKSWTAYPVIISDSWTSVQEYVGKSWYTSIDSIKRAWRSISTPIDVSFTNEGAIIKNPEGYTLNDFYISSKLADSSEIEEWPKILVDDGWEAYSYLNLKVSKNVPFNMYENQELIWYNKNYIESNPGDNSGVISGRYTWLEEDVGYDLTNYKQLSIVLDSSSTINRMVCSTIEPGENINLYDKAVLKSWSSVVEFILNPVDYEGHENEYDLNSCILVSDFSEAKPKQSGIYYYTVDNGVVTMKVSAESGSYYFIEDDEYSTNGIEIFDSEITYQDEVISNIEAGVFPEQGLALVTSSNTYVSVYVPIILISDFGYDLQGGNKIDVSRLDSLGNYYYMNLYCYENIDYQSNKVKVIDNYLYIDLTDTELVGSTTLSYDLPFNLPDGKYLLDVMNSVPNLNNLILSVIPVKDFEAVTVNGEEYSVVLSQIGNKDLTNLYKSRKYYIDLNIEDLKSKNVHFKDCDSFLLRVYMEFNVEPGEDSYNVSGNIRFGLVYKYDKPEFLSSTMYDSILNKMSLLDKDSLYNFTNVVDSDVNIENPLDSNSFLDKNHIYNEFTICQIDTNKSSVLITSNR